MSHIAFMSSASAVLVTEVLGLVTGLVTEVLGLVTGLLLKSSISVAEYYALSLSLSLSLSSMFDFAVNFNTMHPHLRE